MFAKKPPWLDKKVNLYTCHSLKTILRELNLHTVCERTLCPNISECFSQGIATFMILGDICTRNCRFCGVIKGSPKEVDYDEPRRIREAVKLLKLNYIVITSPSRDDLDDGGAEMFCKTVEAIKNLSSSKKVEILIPDFLGKRQSLEKVADCDLEVIAHNIETVPSLYKKVRKAADYNRSLKVLGLIKKINKKVLTKSGLMLGLGEKKSEVIGVLRDLRKVDCDFLTLGQYLPPSLRHFPLKEYIPPSNFTYFKNYALNLGFKGVNSAPYVRSSYLAHSFLSHHI